MFYDFIIHIKFDGEVYISDDAHRKYNHDQIDAILDEAKKMNELSRQLHDKLEELRVSNN